MSIRKELLFFVLAIGFSFNLFSQILEPVKWEHEVEKISEKEFNLTFTAIIDDGWYIYSQTRQDENGFSPTTVFEFNTESDGYELVGVTSEPSVAPVYDTIFEENVVKFKDKADFNQRISILADGLNQIKVFVTYQTCDNTKCIPGDYTFNISLDGSIVEQEDIKIDDRSKALSEALDLNVSGWDNYEKQTVEDKSYFGIFILGFLGGLIALLTPCVFPMIPLTVSFFTKGSSDARKGLLNSILYGFFIFLIYVLLSLPFHVMDSLDSGILNTISTNVTLNIIFFIIFVVFSFSFFGYFELTLPQSWSAAMDNKANKIGGVFGIFFMALTLAIVSFSCTGPILGGLLGSTMTSDASAMQLSMGMGGFGLALALPFTLFAMFPKWLNSLPKSGGWLNTVKVVLGFVELALALKFLSNADLVEHWGLLKREVFIGLWIIIAIGLALYLFGKIKFPHDSPLDKLSRGRITTGILVVAFIIYLLPGLSNTKYANLKLLSGFPPPMFYSLYDKASECPLDLNCYKDLVEGVAAAKLENKPILLDFTGWACVNCRKMEEQVWSTSDVYEILKDEYIIISLYVDDRKMLPENEQFNYLRANGTVKTIETVGDKWTAMQTLNFEDNSQPYYVLLNSDMDLLNVTNAYESNADAYFNWLKTGLKNYHKEQSSTTIFN
ncbi:MAG: DUF255 domain-containing protein [Winogradskyella sp.]|uniref:protein-disulfide reductase DsbD family protein n=1 Tax=Winogradskyella sp. TaxID=1883156 RepID=UPI0018351FDC|nr:DUF255 domain-containing protein [Winogradskyella sp.]